MKLDSLAKFLLAATLALCQLDTQAASQAPAATENGGVVTAQHLTTHVGIDVLKADGNAVDAAVAAMVSPEFDISVWFAGCIIRNIDRCVLMAPATRRNGSPGLRMIPEPAFVENQFVEFDIPISSE